MIPITPIVVASLGGLITLLFAANAFFIKMLINKFQTTHDMVGELRVQVAILSTQLEAFKMFIIKKDHLS